MDEETFNTVSQLQSELEDYRRAERMEKPVWRALNELAALLEIPLAASHEVTVRRAIEIISAQKQVNPPAPHDDGTA